MKLSRHAVGRLVVELTVVSVTLASLALGCVEQAEATIVGVRVRDTNGTVDSRVVETTAPFAPISLTTGAAIPAIANGFAQASASLQDGTLKAIVVEFDVSSTAIPDAIAQLRDIIRLSGTPDIAAACSEGVCRPAQYSFSVSAHVTGTVEGGNSNAFFSLQAGSPSLSPFASSGTVTYGPGPDGIENNVDDIVTRSLAVGVDFCAGAECQSLPIDVNSVLEARIGESSGNVNFGGTAALSLTLGPGVTFTSDSGAFLVASAVPEPGSLLVLATGLASLGAVGLRWRRHPSRLRDRRRREPPKLL